VDDFNYQKHLTVGVTTYIGLSILVPGIELSIPGILASAVFSLLPDLDQLQSKISQYLFKLPTNLLIHLINIGRFVFSGFLFFILMDNQILGISYHSKYEHVVVSAVAATFFFILLEPDENFIKRRVAESIGIILFAYGVLNGEVKFIQVSSIIVTFTIAGHRSIVSHSLLSLFVVIKMTFGTAIMPGAFIGYSLHLLCDHLFEEMRCPLYFPIDFLLGLIKKEKNRSKKSNGLRDSLMLFSNILVSIF